LQGIRPARPAAGGRAGLSRYPRPLWLPLTGRLAAPRSERVSGISSSGQASDSGRRASASSCNAGVFAGRKRIGALSILKARSGA
jgi:hypothetical protein